MNLFSVTVICKQFMLKDFDPYVSGQSTELILSSHGEDVLRMQGGCLNIPWTDDLLTDEYAALARSILSTHGLFG